MALRSVRRRPTAGRGEDEVGRLLGVAARADPIALTDGTVVDLCAPERRRALAALQELDDPRVDALLVGLVREGGAGMRAAVAGALGHRGPAILPALAGALVEREEDVLEEELEAALGSLAAAAAPQTIVACRLIVAAAQAGGAPPPGVTRRLLALLGTPGA